MAAAETGPWDVLKLRDQNGEVFAIDSHIPSNSPQTKYELQVIANGLGMLAESVEVDLKALESRIAKIERHIYSEPPLPPTVQHLKNQVEQFREKLETTESLTWLGEL